MIKLRQFSQALLLMLLLVSCTNDAGFKGTEGGNDGGSELPVIDQIAKRLKEANQRNALISAVIAGNLDQARRLLRAGANPNEDLGTGTDSITPLMAAVILGREEIGIELINYGARSTYRYKGYSIRDFANEVLSDTSALRKGVMYQ